MATKTAQGRDLAAEIAFLTRALKAPSLREAAGRLAERARAESWTHEEFLVACLQREVAARESHGGEGRIRAASTWAGSEMVWCQPQIRSWSATVLPSHRTRTRSRPARTSIRRPITAGCTE